ncbi:serine hydrolase domain-containing protein [Microbulbifer zhoushanensis]|uniref:serine hydrolase domain-containing protein n=1 Tax=Microbulbifer zhoushanensis TaxID=2904254 RepID=UPI001F21DD8D|nr:serine hydrolase domain-containing protein [Microbulbifer zhoushanensis]
MIGSRFITKRVAIKGAVYISVVLLCMALAHYWVTQPLFWKKIPYRLQAYQLAFTGVDCQPGSPQGLAGLLKYHALPDFALAGQVFYINSQGDRYGCRVAPDESSGDHYRLASMTKAVTAHAVLKLAREGLLELDSHLLDYFPEVDVTALRDPRLKSVTVSHLLNHSSGFGGPFGSDNMVKQGETPWCPYDFRQLEKVRLAGRPGTNHVYSNVSYCLLGEVISRVTGVPYRQYVKQHYLSGTKLDFVDGKYLPEEPDYDFINDFKLGREYVNWLDFSALSSAAGLIGPPDAFAAMVWEHFHNDAGKLLNGPLVPGCGKGGVDRCYSWNFELQFNSHGEAIAGVQEGYVPGASSLLAITGEGQVLVWVAAGAAIADGHKEQLKSAVVEFMQSQGMEERLAGVSPAP